MKTINIGMIGLGTIGKGVYDAIVSNGDLIAQRTGVSLKIKGICEIDEKKLSAIDPVFCEKTTSNVDELLNDKDIDIIVELIGGVDPAKEMIIKALENKKHVVTANKALLSKCWKEIFSVAEKNKVLVNFEASVGGAIPVIRAVRQNFVANNIKKIYAILNGTTNFILTDMSEKGCSFDEALKVAQEKGFAESDPELDISGKDSAHKLAILSLLCFGKGFPLDDIYSEGITKIDAQDLENAERWGYSIKLLAVAKELSDGLELRVHPTLLPVSHILSDVNGSNNAVFIEGDLIGESLLFGKGAGKNPTSSSVLGDVVEVAKYKAFVGDEYIMPGKVDYAQDGKKLIPMEDLEVSCYLRFTVIDQPGVLAGISSVLAEHNISIASVSQEERNVGGNVPVVILTHKAREGDMRKAIEKINKQDYISAETVMIRMEE